MFNRPVFCSPYGASCNTGNRSHALLYYASFIQATKHLQKQFRGEFIRIGINNDWEM